MENNPSKCECRKCLKKRGQYKGSFGFMIVCQKCGNKRCPHANSHKNECTGSNEPGQPGSNYQ